MIEFVVGAHLVVAGLASLLIAFLALTWPDYTHVSGGSVAWPGGIGAILILAGSYLLIRFFT